MVIKLITNLVINRYPELLVTTKGYQVSYKVTIKLFYYSTQPVLREYDEKKPHKKAQKAG